MQSQNIQYTRQISYFFFYRFNRNINFKEKNSETRKN